MFIFVAIASYFLTACAATLDKFLITSKKIEHPSVYTFLVGLFSIFTLLIFFPFGFHWVSLGKMAMMLFFGAVFSFGLLALFFAFQKSQTSRVVPVSGVATTITSLLIAVFLFGEDLEARQLGGIFVLILGSFLISVRFFKNRPIKTFSDFPLAVLAGVLLGTAFSFFNKFYVADNFINVFIWTRIGVFLGAMTFILVPGWRSQIFSFFKNLGKNKKKNTQTGIIFVANKLLSGSGSIVFNLALSLGDVAVVNALVATEYVFIFFFGSMLSLKLPKIFLEEKDWLIISQKILSIIIIGVGIWLVR